MQGFTLLEVLISLFLLSLILLGTSAMQFVAQREARSAFYLAVAMEQISSMQSWLLVAKNDLLVEQIDKWNRQNRQVLPNGYGTVFGDYPHYQINLFWGKQEKECNKSKVGLSGCLQINT